MSGHPSIVRASRLRTMFVRMAMTTDASELDVVQAAEAFAEALKKLGARVEGAGVITAHAPIERAAKKFWATPHKSIRDFADAWEDNDDPISETCPTCGGKNWPEEQAWMHENLPRIAARIQRGGKGSIAERKLLSAHNRLMVIQDHLGTLCGSAAGQAAKDQLAAAAREVMKTSGEISQR